MMKRLARMSVPILTSAPAILPAADSAADGRSASCPIDLEAADPDVTVLSAAVPRKPRTPRHVVVDLDEVDEVEMIGFRSGPPRAESLLSSNNHKRQRTPANIQLNNCEISDESNSPKRQVVIHSPPEPPRERKFICPICMNALDEESVTKCGHIFCQSCITTAIKENKKCPICAKKLTIKSFSRVYLPNYDFDS